MKAIVEALAWWSSAPECDPLFLRRLSWRFARFGQAINVEISKMASSAPLCVGHGA